MFYVKLLILRYNIIIRTLKERDMFKKCLKAALFGACVGVVGKYALESDTLVLGSLFVIYLMIEFKSYFLSK